MKRTLLFVAGLAMATQLSAQCCFDINASTHNRQYSPTHGHWCEDPLQTDGAGKVYAFPEYNNEMVFYEYPSLSDFNNNLNAVTHNLTTGYDGTGHVVYGGYLYYNAGNSNNMVKFDISTATEDTVVPLPNAGFHNTYHYQWGGFSDIDFAADETGLWVVYATAANNEKLVVSKLDTADLSIVQTWNTNSEGKKQMGNSFIKCGVLYCIDSYSTTNQTINYVYDMNTSTGTTTSIPWTNANGYMTSCDYNENNNELAVWNSANCYTYPLTNTGPTITLNDTSVLCNADSNGVAIAIVTGGNTPYTYLWDANAGGQTTATATGLAGGTYFVTITDATPCVQVVSVTVNAPAVLAAGMVTTDVLCNGDGDGSIDSDVSGGTPSYSYTWDSNAGNQTTAVATGLSGGTYVVTVTDTNNCELVDTATINEPSAALTNVMSATAQQTSGCDGDATATPSGGTAPYAYQWDANAASQITQTATGLCGGQYLVTVTDTNNCSLVDTVFVEYPTGIAQSGGTTRISVFPNPTSGTFTVKSPENGYFQITDLSGRLVTRGKLNDAIDLGDQPKGVYFLRYKTESLRLILTE